MHIVILTHPVFLGSRSMPKYAKMIAEGMKEREHSVEVWSPEDFFHRISIPRVPGKYLGYLDQFLVFPLKLRKKIKDCPSQTLFVLADQALGPWMPLFSKRPHIVHCHDFLAQRSALGEIPENKVGFSGKIYQKLIRKGYRTGKNFISISQKTRADLHRFLSTAPQFSEIVYNGFNQDFRPGSFLEARQSLENKWEINLKDGYILHVGGNQFYKNRAGVIKAYITWRETNGRKLPLLMIGSPPTELLNDLQRNSVFSGDIHFLTNVSDEFLQTAYQGASLLFYPSLEEGFGWPIAEAMASGCPVITTAEAPMNEVARNSCYYIPRMPKDKVASEMWANFSARVLNRLLELPEEERQRIVDSGIENAKRFNTQQALESIETIYKNVLETYYYENSPRHFINGS